MRAGWTLLEITVSAVLVAVAVVVIVGLIPTTVTSLKKSENMQAATLYAVEVLEDARRTDFVPDASHRRCDRTLEINHIAFAVARDVYALDGEDPPRLYDVVVKVTWKPQPVPVELKTRVYHP